MFHWYIHVSVNHIYIRKNKHTVSIKMTALQNNLLKILVCWCLNKVDRCLLTQYFFLPQFSFNMFDHPIPRVFQNRFSTQYRCFSVSMLAGPNDRSDVEKGGKSMCMFYFEQYTVECYMWIIIFSSIVYGRWLQKQYKAINIIKPGDLLMALWLELKGHCQIK